MVIDYGKIIFGGVDSSDYGIYISGEGVYNAPERDVELVNVPGRNGAIAMDQGRYENISVTYPAMYLGKDQEEFREKLSDFRNAILSQKGYQRLEDSYHPDEYRMGVYASGLEVTKVFRKMRGGEFELTFNCKPQRWLSVGALPTPVDSGDVLQNPTVFDSSPLLEVEGYGTVSFNGFDIEMDNSPLGVVTLITRHYATGSGGIMEKTYNFDRSLLNTGDEISVGMNTFEWYWITQTSEYTQLSFQISDVSTFHPYLTLTDAYGPVWAMIRCLGVSFSALDEDAPEQEELASITITGSRLDGGTDTVYITSRIKCGYDYITFRMEIAANSNVIFRDSIITSSPIEGDSTVQVLGNPTYVDCEVGEAYRIENGEYKSCNSKVFLGADLPVLAPGSNKIIFDNTVTDLKIAPRWWKV